MPRHVVILHGWSDTSKSFAGLTTFLRRNGFAVTPLWLGDYISLDDDVKVEDVGKRFEEVIRANMASDGLDKSFDLIVHSTGGLVAREWLAAYYSDGRNCPVRRLLMLAPANFGSKLASMGKSMLGRVVKGWNNWLHTGQAMLSALELASRYQWDLAQRDLFGPSAAGTPYGTPGVLPFVIIGTHPYTSRLHQIVNENGADGTVRVPAANLNVKGITIDFAANEENPVLTHWQTRHGDLEFPLAVLPDRTHSSIITPTDNEVSSDPASQERLGRLILQALNCAGLPEFRTIQAAWQALSEETVALATDGSRRNSVFPPRPGLFSAAQEPADYFNQYMQVVVRVVDDHGDDVPDFFLEFFGPDSRSDREAVYFHNKVLEEVHVNGPRRCLYIDHTDLLTTYYSLIPAGRQKVVALSVSAAPPGDNISYFKSSKKGAAGHIIVHREGDESQRWLRRNSTHFVKMIIPRTPKEGVFKLTQVPSSGP